MLPDARLVGILGRARRHLVRGRRALLVLLPAIALVAGCSKVPLFAPSGTTITLFTNAQLLPLNGTAQVTASVLEAGGNPVQNGTTVTFTTSLGTVTPSDTTTVDGKATVILNAGTVSGTAEINAFSGANAAKATVKIIIGAAAVTTVVATASPSTVSANGGTSTISATVFDTNNNALPGIPVAFTTDFGSVAPVTATTNANGVATTTLTTNQTSTVTCTAGAKSATAKVTAVTPPTITITGPSALPTVGLTTTFSVVVTAASGAPPIRLVTIDFGDNTPTVSLGAASGTISVPHIYLKSGTFTVTGVVIDAGGQSNSVSVPVVIFPAVPFNLTVTAPSARVNIAVTITATPAAGAPVIVSYQWDFGDGSTATTALGSVPHVYDSIPGNSSSGQFTVTVTATGVDGRIGVGSAIIFISR